MAILGNNPVLMLNVWAFPFSGFLNAQDDIQRLLLNSSDSTVFVGPVEVVDDVTGGLKLLQWGHTNKTS